METDTIWGTMQKEDLKLRMKQVLLNKTYWQTSPHLNQASLQEIEACRALRVTIITTNLEYISTLGWTNLNMHIKDYKGKEKKA